MQEGVIFFVINIVGNFGTVFLDNGYVLTVETSIIADIYL